MPFIRYFFACITLCLSSWAFAAEPIQNLLDVPVPVNLDGSTPKLEDVKKAIISGCRARGWTPVLGQTGNLITASQLVRSKHFAEVDISYSEKSYSIVYKSSRDLDYDEKKQKIHRNYNKWVVILSNAIQREFSASH